MNILCRLGWHKWTNTINIRRYPNGIICFDESIKRCLNCQKEKFADLDEEKRFEIKDQILREEEKIKRSSQEHLMNKYFACYSEEK